MLAPPVQFLEVDIESSCEFANQAVCRHKFVELVSMDRHVPLTCQVPCILLIYPYADKVGHDVCKPVIVVSLDPDDFNATLGIRQFPDIRKKVPVFLGQAPEVKVAENVAKQNQALEAQGTQERKGFPRFRGL
jgi:hypothetical protein